MLEASQEGRAMVRQAFAAGMPWGDPSLGEYVNRLGQELARRSGNPQAFAFYVLSIPASTPKPFPEARSSSTPELSAWLKTRRN